MCDVGPAIPFSRLQIVVKYRSLAYFTFFPSRILFQLHDITRILSFFFFVVLRQHVDEEVVRRVYMCDSSLKVLFPLSSIE